MLATRKFGHLSHRREYWHRREESLPRKQEELERNERVSGFEDGRNDGLMDDNAIDRPYSTVLEEAQEALKNNCQQMPHFNDILGLPTSPEAQIPDI